MLPAVVDHSNLQHFCDRVVDGLAGIFLALKRRPVIRYSRTSDIAKRIAQEAGVRKENIQDGIYLRYVLNFIRYSLFSVFFQWLNAYVFLFGEILKNLVGITPHSYFVCIDKRLY